MRDREIGRFARDSRHAGTVARASRSLRWERPAPARGQSLSRPQRRNARATEGGTPALLQPAASSTIVSRSPHASFPHNAFTVWAQIERRLRAAEGWVLFLDFDGTLVPLVNHPNQVRLERAVRKLLRSLARHPHLTVYIISGRRLDNLRKVASVPGVHLLGLHGWEEPGATLPIEQQQVLREAKRWLEPRHPRSSGIWLEDKGLAIGVHHRGASPAAGRLAKQLTLQARRRFAPELNVMRGRKLWELLPAAVKGKGEATRELLRDLPSHTLPICIGDDASDETAFAALRNGMTLHVGGKGRTKAKYWLRNPTEVREFLERLEVVANCRKPSALSNS